MTSPNNALQPTASLAALTSQRLNRMPFATPDTSTELKSTEPDHSDKPCWQALPVVQRLE